MQKKHLQIIAVVVLVAAAAFLLWRQYRTPTMPDAGEAITIVFPDNSEVRSTMSEVYQRAAMSPAKAYADERGNWFVIYEGKELPGLVKRDKPVQPR